ncbi:hypothetical protein HBN50_14735 [Halobacteriovorax sp. GB3]|uniref:hypothetical protein n=1 Tax=Halobacteriovorax sp. GB3 TaxID=2719615 RepID=UPI00235E4F96|nr:hypothetical protein [Halobacteriovorax sp. GB3]MDD0854366.1 hypothetical protein [Halobacteriovorax sp. GB3]
MIKSNTSFGKLKTVIVGRELEITKRVADFSFQHFYKENLTHAVYDKLISDEETYYVNHEFLVKRVEQLDDLAKKLGNLGVEVKRPNRLTKVIPFTTPDFKSELSSASNVRDVSLVYGDTIFETPTYVRNRYYENTLLYDVFNEAFDCGQGGKWIKSPFNQLIEEKMDLENWDSHRDYSSFDRSKYTMAIDGAQFLRIGRDVIVNVNSYNHYLGLEWIKSFYPDSHFHIVHVADNHIDGVLVCLRPGVFLVNPKYPNLKNIMPKKFQNWEYLYPQDYEVEPKITEGMTNIDIQLASTRGMDINILSLDEKTVLVNESAVSVIELLSKNSFDVETVRLDNCEIFGGGIHCSTLDLHREDEYRDYTK